MLYLVGFHKTRRDVFFMEYIIAVSLPIILLAMYAIIVEIKK